VQQLLGRQRSIAESLQRALLPRKLPELPGLQVAAQYLPGVEGVEIGGDWYDLMPLPDGRFFFVVGDVSGRGVEAGAVMASLRFAIRAYAGDGLAPEAVLVRLTHLLDLDRDKHFATVLCGIGDIAAREITLANAGHPPPLLVADGTGELVRTPVGPPIGVSPFAEYPSVTVAVPDGATLIAYTDGLIERRGEDLADSLARLRTAAAARPAGDLDALLTHLVDTFSADAPDDTAVLGVRWVR
jgi:serine phosphatase RsbU (regulator of sigma subunit)